MSTIRIITASAAPASPGNAASSVSASAVLSSAARKLADLDGDKLPAWAYQHQLDLLAPKCTNGKDNLAGVANATLEDLRKNGIHDETEYSVLQHLNQSVPPGLEKLDCTGIAAAYLVLREGH